MRWVTAASGFLAASILPSLCSAFVPPWQLRRGADPSLLSSPFSAASTACLTSPLARRSGGDNTASGNQGRTQLTPACTARAWTCAFPVVRGGALLAQAGGPAPPGQQQQQEEGLDEDEYSVTTRLREEAESPFRNVRFFAYAGFAASGTIGFLTSLTGALAAASGVRGAKPLGESVTDLAIDLGAIVVSALLWNAENKAKSSKLERMTLGAKIAGLRVQTQGAEDGAVLSVADFRRYRGNAKRVIIFAGKLEAVQRSLDTALALKARLLANDFVLVPVVLPASPSESATSLAATQERLQNALGQEHVAWPMVLREWREYLDVEAAAARKQGLDPYEQGIAVVLKLNGRVGQRSFGSPAWETLIGDVESRRRRGMDVTNI